VHQRRSSVVQAPFGRARAAAPVARAPRTLALRLRGRLEQGNRNSGSFLTHGTILTNQRPLYTPVPALWPCLKSNEESISYTTSQNPDASGVAHQTQHHHCPYLIPTCSMPLSQAPFGAPSPSPLPSENLKNNCGLYSTCTALAGIALSSSIAPSFCPQPVSSQQSDRHRHNTPASQVTYKTANICAVPVLLKGPPSGRPPAGGYTPAKWGTRPEGGQLHWGMSWGGLSLP